MTEAEDVSALWAGVLSDNEVGWCRACDEVSRQSHLAGTATAATVHLSWVPDDRVNIHRALWLIGWIMTKRQETGSMTQQQRSLLAFDWATAAMREGGLAVPQQVLDARAGIAGIVEDLVGEESGEQG